MLLPDDDNYHVDELVWNTSSLLNLLVRHDIHSRGELAARIGASRSRIYEAFDDNWRGRATPMLIYRLARLFNCPLSAIVLEPAALNRRPPRPPRPPHRPPHPLPVQKRSAT